MSRWLRFLWHPLLALIHPLQSMPVASWGVPYKPDNWRRKNSSLDYRWLCIICWYHLKVDSCSITGPLRGFSEGQCWRKTLLVSISSSNMHGCPPCLEWEMTRNMDLHLLMDICQSFGWMIRDLAETGLEDWWQGSLSKTYMNDIFFEFLNLFFYTAGSY